MAESNFTVRVDDELKEAFTKAAKAADRTGGQLVRDFMRGYIRERAEHQDFVRRKVEEGLKAAREGRVLTQDEVDRRAASRKARILKQAKARAR